MISPTRRMTAGLLCVAIPLGGLGAGCESQGKWGNAGIGGLIGAASGAAIAVAAGGDDEDILIAAGAGAVLGAGVGYVVGSEFEKRAVAREEKERAEAIYQQQMAEAAKQSGEETTVEESSKAMDQLVDAAARETEAPNGGRVAVEVDRGPDESTFVLIDPLTGQAEESAYTLSSEEAEKFRNTGNTFAQIDGYTVLVSGAEGA